MKIPGPRTKAVLAESVAKFARHVARRPHLDNGHTYPAHIPSEERARRDAVRSASLLLSDEREWALVQSLAEQYGVDLATIGTADPLTV